MTTYMGDKVLEIQQLVTQFRKDNQWITIIDDLSLDLTRGSALGIVGESGSGKSAMALSLMRLIAPPIGRVSGRGILLEGKNLMELSDKEMEGIRGNRIAMIFQEPMTSLNPVYTVGEQIMETIQLHQQVGKQEASMRCLESLTLVGIPAPRQRMLAYPHQLSGGMRQRVMIAMALACNPSVLIADEPTTALDVTTQAQIIDLMQKIQADVHMSIILITHDLGVVAKMCDQVAVMYSGQIVEKTSVKAIFNHPLHPYTRALLEAIPAFGHIGSSSSRRLPTIEGMVPSFLELPVGCTFQDRCPNVADLCKKQKPLLQEIEPDHFVACFYPLSSKGPSKIEHALCTPIKKFY